MNKHLLFGGIATALANAALAADPHSTDLEKIVVTAAPIATGERSMAQPASVLAGEALALEAAPTIGETLAREPGVHSSYFGPAASRPVIRGLGGGRVQVLTDGLATLDASGVSEDHAVAVDPALADQVEVLRGPATLLYGSGAAGGLVNVVTNRWHETPGDHVHGMVELRGDTALGERALAGRMDAGSGSFNLHLDGVWRETEDFEVPGEAGDEIVNTWSETRAGGVGASWVGESASIGLALSRHDTEYGVPNEDGLFIDLVQDRVDLSARFAELAGSGWSLRLRGAVHDYQHAEVEPGGEIGTLFEIEGQEFRAVLDGTLPGGFAASAGVQWQETDLAAAGEEAFVPPSVTRAVGLFAFGRRAIGAGSLELGLRLDRQEIDALGFEEYEDESVNASAGLTWPIAGELELVAQLVRSERHPSASELFADGPHAATQQFEIGDPAIGTERGWTVDLGLRRTARTRAELRAFASRYDGYIFLSPTGDVMDDLPVFVFLQDDARFYGVEAQFDLPLDAAATTVLSLSGDYVEGRLDDGGDLPRIPPLRLGAELSWTGQALAASLAVRHHFSQDRIAAFETGTDSYTMLDATLSWRPGWGGLDALLFLKASNLLDEVARVHSSPLKDTVPLPGRSFAAGLRFSFGGEGG